MVDRRSDYIPGAARLMLARFGEEVFHAVGVAFLVGSALERADYRDVDVRVVLEDDAFDRLAALTDIAQGRQSSFNLAFSAFGERMTGLPIDFQIQRMTEANRDFDGARQALFVPTRRRGEGGDVTPIIFSGPMVRAILDGRKTQTRRLLKCDDAANADDVFFEERGGFWFPVVEVGDGVFRATGEPIRCPYGVPGDKLWVRESWGVVRSLGADRDHDSHECVYRADGGSPTLADGRWRSPILMPREASRLTLVVESVRVERLSAISNEDAMAEGIDWHSRVGVDGNGPSPRECFIDAFRAMHKLAADADPWLWVVTFSRAAEAKE